MASPPGRPGRIINFIRDFLIGRHVAASPYLRATEVCSTRSPTAPNLPKGPAHVLSSNYYYTRDLRGSVNPPLVSSSTKLLAQTSEENAEQSPLAIPPTPGIAHQWRQHQT